MTRIRDAPSFYQRFSRNLVRNRYWNIACFFRCRVHYRRWRVVQNGLLQLEAIDVYNRIETMRLDCIKIPKVCG